MPRAVQATTRASQISERSVSRGPRGFSWNTRWYSRWIAVPAAIPARMKKAHDRPVTALEVAEEEAYPLPRPPIGWHQPVALPFLHLQALWPVNGVLPLHSQIT